MVPNKFEESIKNRLEKRTIQPSSDTWNRLEKQLNHSKEKSKNKPLLWIGLAASIVGVLLVVSQFLKEAKIESNTPVIVVTPKTVNKENQKQVIAKEIDNQETVNKIENPKLELKTNLVIEKPLINIETKAPEERTIIYNVASIENKNLIQDKIQPIKLKQEALSIEDQKIKDVVAQVKILKEKNQTITDSDIEALLQQAQKEIRAQKLYNENTGVVDATLLLQEVETDLDKSFRDKVFEALKANFNFVKTAVAQRND